MRRIVLTGAIALILTLALTGVAYAASPWDIYEDYAADGDLDGTYTDRELQAYLDSAYVDQYGSIVIITELDSVVKRILSARDRFPFTGAEVAVAAAALCALLGAGVGLRRLAVRQARS
jgi:hypothetical protein